MSTNAKHEARSCRTGLRLRHSFSALAALGALALLSGCGGGSNNNGSVGQLNSPFAGSYQGVYLNTSGAVDARPVVMTISSSGVVSASANPFLGVVSNTGVFSGSGANAVVTADSTTHALTGTYTLTDAQQTKGTFHVGIVPTASPLSGNFSGTVTNANGKTSTLLLTIQSNGLMGGLLTQNSTSANFSGYVDASNIIYAAYVSNSLARNATGPLTLSGGNLTGTLQETASDGTSTTVTLNLAKQ